eukprot:SAG31_NODE_4526_length_3164_cov_1.693312_1_plen_162_part_10
MKRGADAHQHCGCGLPLRCSYIPALLKATHPPSSPTMNTCRHLKRLTLLAHHLDIAKFSEPGPDWSNLRILEIGGGNGNMARLAANAFGWGRFAPRIPPVFRDRFCYGVSVDQLPLLCSWTVVDFPVMNELQSWYMNKTVSPVRLLRNEEEDPTAALERSAP